MALRLQDVVDIVYDCTEDGTRIAIIGNKQLADSIDVYLRDTEFMGWNSNVLIYTIPFDNRSDDYIIDINCTNGIYEYSVEYYKLNDILDYRYDQVHIFSDKVIGKFDKNTINSDLYKFYGYFSIGNEEIYHILDEIHGEIVEKVSEPIKEMETKTMPFSEFENMFTRMITKKADKPTVTDEEVKNSNPILDVFNEIFSTPKVFKMPSTELTSCVECCADCDDMDCEYQGDKSDCECDSCVQERVDNCKCEDCAIADNKTTWKTINEECKCDDCIKENIVEKYLSSIDEVDGCEDCIENLLRDMFEEVKLIGWNAHKEYIDCCNDEEM